MKLKELKRIMLNYLMNNTSISKIQQIFLLTGYFFYILKAFSEIAAEVDFTLSFLPVVVYLNADTQKKDIIKENRNKCGIYR